MRGCWYHRILIASLLATSSLSVVAQGDDLDWLLQESAATPTPTPTQQSAVDSTTAEHTAVIALPPAATPPPNSTSARSSRQIEEIIVNAQKTEQSLNEVPISMTALEGDFMRKLGARNLQDVAAYIPNVRFSSDTDPALAQINVRGFGSNPLNAAFESSVAFVQDDLYFARPGYFSEAIFDVDRVEVLRGPQGTLFGKNTVAGVFNVYSKQAGRQWSGDVRASLADPREQRLEAGVGGPLTDNLGVRASLLEFDREGGLQNNLQARNSDDFQQSAQRIKANWLPLDQLSLDLTWVNSDTRSAYWPLQLNRLDADTTAFLRRYDPHVEGSIEDYRLSHDTPGFLNKGSDTLGLSANWALGAVGGLDDLNSTVVLGDSELYIDSLVDLDASPANIATLIVRSQHEQRTAEIRLAGRENSGLLGWGNSVEFVVGGYHYQGRFNQLTIIETGQDFGAYIATQDAIMLATSGQAGAGLGGLLNPLTNLVPVGAVITTAVGEDSVSLNYLLHTRSSALFGQATWYLNDQFALTPGLRYTRESKTVDANGASQCRTDALGVCVLGFALGASNYEQNGLQRDETDVSPKLSLQYFQNDDINYFLSYATGFKSGGFNGSSFDGEALEFEDEKARTYELGIKSFLLDRSLSINATVFRTELDNLQVLAFNGAFFDVTNAASAFSQGLEVDFNWLTPWPILSMNGSLGLLDARYERYPDAPAPIAQGGDATQDLSDKRIALAPEQTLSLTPTFTLPLFGLGMQWAVDFLYQGDVFTDTDLDPATFVAANWLFNTRLSVGAQDQSWSVSLVANNLSNEKLFTQNIDTVFFPGTFNGTQKAERQLLLALSWRF